MLRFSMNIENQRLQLRLETEVVVGAAKATLAAELIEGDPADRASLLVQFLQVLGCLPHCHLLGHLLSHVLGHGRCHPLASLRLFTTCRQILPRVVLA